MRRTHFASLLLILPAVAGAEPRLTSEPAGVHVILEGPISLSGVTPLPIADLPAGEYRLTAGGLGTAVVRGRVVHRADDRMTAEPPGGPGTFLLPPGAAHFRGHEGGRGWLFLGAGGIGGLGTVLSEASRRDAADDVERAESLYRLAVSEEAIARARFALEAARDERGDAGEMRNLWGAYFGAVWLGAAVESAFLTASPSFRPGGDGLLLQVPRAGGGAAAWRSALVPGAGQRWVGHEGRGNLMTGAVLVLGAGALVAQDAFLDARREQADAQRRYDAAETVEDLESRRSALEDAADRAGNRGTLRWALAGATAGAYLWNVLDAWGMGNRAGSGLGPDSPPLGVSIFPNGDGLETAVSWRVW